MKYLLLIFILQGCLYFNDRGISAHFYDNCHSYYDCNGTFIEECNDDLVSYKEINQGIEDIGSEIKDKVNSINNQLKDKISGSKIKPEKLSKQNSTIKENFKPIPKCTKNRPEKTLLKIEKNIIKEDFELIPDCCK